MIVQILWQDPWTKCNCRTFARFGSVTGFGEKIGSCVTSWPWWPVCIRRVWSSPADTWPQWSWGDTCHVGWWSWTRGLTRVSRAGGMSRSLRNLTLRFSWIVSSGLSVVEKYIQCDIRKQFFYKEIKIWSPIRDKSCKKPSQGQNLDPLELVVGSRNLVLIDHIRIFSLSFYLWRNSFSFGGFFT